MRKATYYLDNGREIDILEISEGHYLAKDGFLNDEEKEFTYFPTWEMINSIFGQEL